MYVFRSRVRSLSFTVRCRCSFPYAMFCRAAPRGSTLGSRSGGAVDAAAELLDREVRQHRHQYGRRDAPGRCDEVRVAGAGNGCHAVDDAESGSTPETRFHRTNRSRSVLDRVANHPPRAKGLDLLDSRDSYGFRHPDGLERW